MSSQHHEPDLIREWLDETYEAERDPSRFLDQVIEAVPTTPQRRRRWWYRVSTRRVRTLSATDTTEYQPSPVPASNGHSPTVIGRTSSMLSPVKAITVGALVFALGSAFLIAQPFGQQAGVPGATTDEGRAAPVEVTARWVFGPEIRIGTEETIDGVVRAAGYAWRPAAIVRPSDPRLDGRLSIAANSDDHAASGGPTVWHAAFRIENDEGAWQMRPSVGLTHVDGTNAPEVGVFDGEGAYEGLTAVVAIQVDPDAETWDLHGYILDGGLPPEPEPVVGE